MSEGIGKMGVSEGIGKMGVSEGVRKMGVSEGRVMRVRMEMGIHVRVW